MATNEVVHAVAKSSTVAVQISRFENGEPQVLTDTLAIEEPLEIRLDWQDPLRGRQQKSISITMRTPGDDIELACGFLLTEGVLDPLLAKDAQVQSAQHCGPAQAHLGHSNIVKVILSDSVPVNLKSMERNFYTTSSCGVCGKASIDALRLKNADEMIGLRENSMSLTRDFIPRLPELLRSAQKIFNSTGGLHASGLFEASGKLQVLREDVGRHNALDKVIGWAFANDSLPLSQSILVLSGRISFELVQKAAMAGIPMVVAVGAPSSLALELAREAKITLIGFVRGERFNVYHDEGRLV